MTERVLVDILHSRTHIDTTTDTICKLFTLINDHTIFPPSPRPLGSLIICFLLTLYYILASCVNDKHSQACLGDVCVRRLEDACIPTLYIWLIGYETCFGWSDGRKRLRADGIRGMMCTWETAERWNL